MTGTLTGGRAFTKTGTEPDECERGSYNSIIGVRPLSPYDRLVNLLEVWRDQGLSGIRELVAKGPAPVAALAILSSEDERLSPPGLLQSPSS